MTQIDFRVDPTIISTDIESVRLGKDLGASRAVEFLAAQGITPQAWRTVGDSRTDYAMADWLHHNDHAVKHVDVRPADGIPVKPYEVLTAADLGLGADVIHDDAGAAFLHSWRPSSAAEVASRSCIPASLAAGPPRQFRGFLGPRYHASKCNPPREAGESTSPKQRSKTRSTMAARHPRTPTPRSRRRRPWPDSGTAPMSSAGAAAMR